jgi:outer membrane protein OmpA-like peptidoglycan-associated protein
MKKQEKYQLLISGHTDNVGNDALNLELSRKRSEAVKTFLIGQGVRADRLTTEWFGETKPVADNATPEGRDRNRRVEMKVLFE